ncbi:MAG: prenyltransferase/squalene oxidase repeat-containing protein, partial [Planctomycetota bacterium]
RAGLEYLLNNRPTRNRPGRQDFHYFYGHYYAIQAFYQAGGRWWERWWGPVQRDLVKDQKSDGSWYDEVGSHYATAMAVLILSVPLEYLPIFQR